MEKSLDNLQRYEARLEEVKAMSEGNYKTFNEAYPLLKENLSILVTGTLSTLEAMRQE